MCKYISKVIRYAGPLLTFTCVLHFFFDVYPNILAQVAITTKPDACESVRNQNCFY